VQVTRRLGIAVSHSTQSPRSGHASLRIDGTRRLNVPNRVGTNSISLTVRLSPITARTALYLCSVTLISLMRGSVTNQPKLGVTHQPKCVTRQPKAFWDLSPELAQQIGSGLGIRTLNLAVNRSLPLAQKWRLEFAECRPVPPIATFYRPRCCSKQPARVAGRACPALVFTLSHPASERTRESSWPRLGRPQRYNRRAQSACERTSRRSRESSR